MQTQITVEFRNVSYIVRPTDEYTVKDVKLDIIKIASEGRRKGLFTIDNMELYQVYTIEENISSRPGLHYPEDKPKTPVNLKTIGHLKNDMKISDLFEEWKTLVRDTKELTFMLMLYM